MSWLKRLLFGPPPPPKIDVEELEARYNSHDSIIKSAQDSLTLVTRINETLESNQWTADLIRGVYVPRRKTSVRRNLHGSQTR